MKRISTFVGKNFSPVNLEEFSKVMPKGIVGQPVAWYPRIQLTVTKATETHKNADKSTFKDSPTNRMEILQEIFQKQINDP